MTIIRHALVFIALAGAIPTHAQGPGPFAHEPSFVFSLPLGQPTLTAVHGVAVDAAGNIYASDYHCVQKFDPSGAFVAAYGAQGSGTGQLDPSRADSRLLQRLF